MLWDSWKMPYALLLKSTKNKKMPEFFSGFRGPNNPPTNVLRPLFDSQFFLSFNFYFWSQDTWVGLSWHGVPIVHLHRSSQ